MPSLRKPALAALAMLALKWEFHRVTFRRDGPIVQAVAHPNPSLTPTPIPTPTPTQNPTNPQRLPAVQAVIRLARDNVGVGNPAQQGLGGAQDDAELARLSSAVLAHLSAARELRLAARHALPRPRGLASAAETADVAALVTALSAPSVDTVHIATTALANLSATSSNRDKIATRHCAAQVSSEQ